MPENNPNPRIVQKEKKSIFNTIARYGRDIGTAFSLLNKKTKQERIEQVKEFIKDLPSTHSEITLVALCDKLGLQGVPYRTLVKLVEQMIKDGEIDASIDTDTVVFHKESANEILKDIRNNTERIIKQEEKLEEKTSALQADISDIKELTSQINQKIQDDIPDDIKQMIEKAGDFELKQKFLILLERLDQEKKERPNANINKFKNQVDYLINKLNDIKEKLKPNLENKLDLHFKNPELLILALCRPHIARAIISLRDHFKNIPFPTLTPEEYSKLSTTEKVSGNLALIGDAILDVGVIPHIWNTESDDPNILSKRRSDIVKNKNLAKICDKWELCKFRLNKLNDPAEKTMPEDDIIHEKGTLVEAILGVIYIEYGLEKIKKLIPLLE